MTRINGRGLFNSGDDLMKLFIAILITTLLAGACSRTGSVESPPAESDRQTSEKIQVIMLYPNIEEEHKLQMAVDNGGQSWRLDPVEVAHASMINQGVNAGIEDCDLVSQDETHAVIKVHSKAGQDLNVYVEKLMRPNGIWTAMKVEVEDDGTQPLASQETAHSHDHQHY